MFVQETFSILINLKFSFYFKFLGVNIYYLIKKSKGIKFHYLSSILELKFEI